MHRLHMGCIEVDDLLSVLLLMFWRPGFAVDALKTTATQ